MSKGLTFYFNPAQDGAVKPVGTAGQVSGMIKGTDDDTGKGGNFRNKGKDKGAGRRGKRHEDRRGGKPAAKQDFAFWNEYPELMGEAIKFPWMYIAGQTITGIDANITPACIAVQHYLPIPGYQDAGTSPLNITFRELYLDMHRKYRGIGTYQASDIAITILSIEGALQMIIELERIYGILNVIPVKNRTQPDAILRAMGYTNQLISDTKRNLADFRYSINRLIDYAKRLPLPKGMSFFSSHTLLNALLFADSQDERAATIVFVSDGFFQYETTGDDHCINGAGTAYLAPFARSSFTTHNQLVSYVESALQVLLTDSDILKITSDFISCYGEDNMQVLTPLTEDYKIVPTYSASVLSKWHNSERTGTFAPNAYRAISTSTTQLPLSDLGFVVYQENDIVYSMPVYCGTTNFGWKSHRNGYLPMSNPSGGFNYMKRDTVLDTWEPNPSEEVRCEACLWKVRTYYYQDTSSTPVVGCNEYMEFATEIMTKVEIFSAVNGAPSLETTLQDYVLHQIAWTTSGTQFAAISKFDWAPYVLSISGVNPSQFSVYATLNGMCGDIDNLTTIGYDVVHKVVDAALLSAFKIKVSPGSGK